jgi:uncharacterized protein (TIGR00369 family)
VAATLSPDADFPPSRHAISLLDLDIELGPGSDVRGWMTVTPEMSTPSGAVSLAAIGNMIDTIGGTSAVVAAIPDWVFTADMSIHLFPRARVSEVVGTVHVRRRGRRTLVQEIALRGPAGEAVGRGTTTFVLARRPPDSPDLGDQAFDGRQRFWPMPDHEPPPGPYLDELGVRHVGPGEVSIDLRWEVANNIGALNGGVQAALIDEASASLGRVHLDATAATTDAHVAFLAPGLKGPLRAVATLVGDPAPEGDRLTAEVRLVDADGTLCTFATTEVVVP